MQRRFEIYYSENPSQLPLQEEPIDRSDWGVRVELPAKVWEVVDSPRRLFIEGRREALALFERLPDRGFAVVGTRIPQQRSIYFARKSLQTLRGQNLVILSGMARGIDTVAHQTALEIGLPTIGILATGILLNYPAENLELRRQILDAGGLMVSEFDPKVKARPVHFLLRNRLIAQWAKATWVVEAGMKSGALNTAKWARDAHRDCFATPCFPGDPSLAGNQILMDRDIAYPFWGPNDLGTVWVELSTLGSRSVRTKTERGDSDLEKMLSWLRERTYERGGSQPSELVDWAVGTLGWTPERLYQILGGALEQGAVIEQLGVFLSH